FPVRADTAMNVIGDEIDAHRGHPLPPARLQTTFLRAGKSHMSRWHGSCEKAFVQTITEMTMMVKRLFTVLLLSIGLAACGSMPGYDSTGIDNNQVRSG